MTQTLRAPLSNNPDRQPCYAYSALESPPSSELRARTASTVGEGLYHFDDFLENNTPPLPEEKLATLLDLVQICATQESPVRPQELDTLRALLVASANEIASNERTVVVDGHAETRTVEHELADVYLLEQTASALEAYPDDQHEVLNHCLRVAREVSERVPGITDSVTGSIAVYRVQYPGGGPHQTLEQTVRSVEFPVHNSVMAAYEKRIQEMNMEQRLTETERERLATAPKPEENILRIDDYRELKRAQQLARAARIRTASAEHGSDDTTVKASLDELLAD